MIYLKHQISTVIFLLLAFQLTSGQNLEAREQKDSRLENLSKQAEMIIDVLKKNDLEKFFEMTHPIVIEKIGGKQKFISTIKIANDQFSKVFESYSYAVEKPTELVEIEKILFGVVPLKVEAITLQKNKYIANDCMVGVSSDNGITWKFVSGKKFDEFFPSAKGKIPIIKQTIFLNGIEQ